MGSMLVLLTGHEQLETVHQGPDAPPACHDCSLGIAEVQYGHVAQSRRTLSPAAYLDVMFRPGLRRSGGRSALARLCAQHEELVPSGAQRPDLLAVDGGLRATGPGGVSPASAADRQT